MAQPLPRVKRYPQLPGQPVSVTSVLGAVWPKPGLERWKQTQAVKIGRQYPELTADKVIALRDGDTGARDRGSRVHKAIESRVTERPDLLPFLEGEQKRMFGHWLDWWEQRQMTVLASELVVGTSLYAGTLDLLALDGFGLEDESMGPAPRVVVDWKTTGTLPVEPYEEHCAQVAAYAEAHFFQDQDQFGRPMGSINYGLVVYISTKGVAAFVIDGDDWKRAKDRWHAAWHFFVTLYPEMVRVTADA